MTCLNKLSLSVLVFFFVPLFQAQAAPTRWIVKDANFSEFSKEVVKNRGKVIRRMNYVNAFVVEDVPEYSIRTLQKRYPGSTVLPDVRVQLSPDGEVKVSRRSLDQPPQTAQWGYDAIQAGAAHKISQGRGVKVCVVDTGVAQNHLDLQRNILGGKNYVANFEGAIDPAAWEDDHGHGTHVTGIIAARDNKIGIIGVAPKAKIYAMKVISFEGWGFLSDVSDGVFECVRLGAHVINMSLSAEASPLDDYPLKTAVETAIAHGIKVVAASGNFGVDYNTTIPAGYPGVIVAAAMDVTNQIPFWSNYGLSAKDFTAPGEDIMSTYLGNSYAMMSGTSMAAPHVSGVIALQISSRSSSLKATDLFFPMERQGSGLINALQSVERR